jgi:phosphatidylglycerol:prolipoprotein diacylglycerol transferase
MTFDRFAINIGPVAIRYFGLILIVGMVAGGYLATREARRRGQNPEHLLDALTWGLIGGLVGARLLHVLNPPPSMQVQGLTAGWYLAHPFDLQQGPFAIWNGGLSAVGALLGGLLAVCIFLWRNKLAVWVWADILIFGLLLGAAIASWGNIVNQQLYGPPTSAPWGMRVIAERRLPPYTDLTAWPLTDGFHPIPAYQSLWGLATLGALWLIERRRGERLVAGDLFLLGALIYLPGLFALDFLRLDNSRMLAGLSLEQGVMVVLFGLALYAFIRRRRGLGESSEG